MSHNLEKYLDKHNVLVYDLLDRKKRPTTKISFKTKSEKKIKKIPYITYDPQLTKVSTQKLYGFRKKVFDEEKEGSNGFLDMLKGKKLPAS